MKLLALPVIAMLVAACGDSETLEIEAKTDNPDLVFSYPTDGQRNVSPAAQVILRFSEPVDTESLKASAKLTTGTDVIDYSLKRIDGGYSVSLMPADVFVQDRRITVDPCVAESAANCGLPGDKLTSGERYTLNIQSLPSDTGKHLSTKTEFMAIETTPTVVQFQNVTDPGITEGSADMVLSKLNGQPVNGVILNSMLLGTTDASESSGGLYSELAYAPAFGADEPLPIRVPRGTRLIGSSIDVKANGTVSVLDADTGQSLRSGALNVITITDATGYLIPNPYTDDVEAPSHVRLFIDAAMTTEAASPNAALTQNLLHIELVGIARVTDGLLTIDVMAVLEPNLLGREVADSTVAFQITADTAIDAQMKAFDNRAPDRDPPELVSWSPGPDGEYDFMPDRDEMHRPGNPVFR